MGKGVEPRERIKSILDSKLFEKVKSVRSEEEIFGKIVMIEGDMTGDNLGISPSDEKVMIESNIGVVIHSAATIKFDEPIRIALTVNTLGTLKVIRLSRKFPNLKCLVHVSTAFSNCDLQHIEEKIYKSRFNPHKVVDALEWLPTEALNMVKPMLVGTKPNTYTFTKQLAENLFIEENQVGGDSTSPPVPFVIVRPTIVGATLKEPLRGWIDNYSGASGLFVACGMGLLRTMMAFPDAVSNLVPVDIVANIVIAAPWFRESKKLQLHALGESEEYKSPEKTDHNLVINCESGHITKPLIWDEVPKLIERFYSESPFEKAVRYPRMRVTDNRLKYIFYTFFCHYTPAMMMDALLKCMGQKPKLYNMYNKLHKSLQTLDFFTQHHWKWDVNNLNDMEQLLQTIKSSRAQSTKPREQESSWTDDWNVSLQGLDWTKYIEFYCLGTKKFVMKEEMSKMGKARKRMQRLKLVHYLIVTFITLTTAKISQMLIRVMIKIYRAIESGKAIPKSIQKVAQLQ